MLRLLIAASIVFAWIPATVAQPPDGVSEAIQRGLAFLEQDALSWKAEHNCATCHHAPMMIWSLTEAKSLGYVVNDKSLTEIIDWVTAPGDPAKVYPPPRTSDQPRIVSFAPLNHALALGTVDLRAEQWQPAWERLLDTLAYAGTAWATLGLMRSIPAPR